LSNKNKNKYTELQKNVIFHKNAIDKKSALFKANTKPTTGSTSNDVVIKVIYTDARSLT